MLFARLVTPPKLSPSDADKGIEKYDVRVKKGDLMPYIFQIATSASQDRLEKPVVESLAPHADKTEIDARIRDLFGEARAIMFTDPRGYSFRASTWDTLDYERVLRIGDHDVFGAEVNAAAKLGEDSAKPWDILVTQSVRDAAERRPETGFEPIEDLPPGSTAAYRIRYSI
jgi:hypothetical protein